MKKRTVFTIIFVIIAACAIGGGFFALHQKDKTETTASNSVYTLADEAYQAAAKPLGVKVYAGDIDGLFYSLSPVKYYFVRNGVPEEIKPVGTVKIAPMVAGTKMTFEIPFVQVENDIFGVAVWHSDSGVYNDAFAVLKKMPASLGSSKPYLLLVDTTRGDFSAVQRCFSELFSLDKKGNIGGYVFDQRNRTVQSDGKLRTDWDVITLSMLQAAKDGVYSLTGRKYNRNEQNQTYDLRLSKNGNTETVVKNVSDCFFSAQSNTVLFLRQTDGGDVLIALQAGKEQELAVLPGVFGDEYSLFESTAILTSGKTLIDLTDGKEYAQFRSFKTVYAAGVQENRIVCIGKEENRDGEDFKVQKIVIFDKSDNREQTIYANNIMDENSTLALCKEGILTQKDGKSVFISFASLENIAGDVVQ